MLVIASWGKKLLDFGIFCEFFGLRIFALVCFTHQAMACKALI